MSIIQRLAILVVSVSVAAGAQANETGSTAPVFNSPLPGTYLVDFLIEKVVFEGEEFICDPNEIICDTQAVIQFQQGGTFSEISQSTLFVSGWNSAGDTLNARTVRLGDWRQVRFDKVTASAIRFGVTFGPYRDDPLYFGTTTIIDYHIDLNLANRTFSGRFESRSYAIDEDPYDPATVPTQTVSGSIVKGAPLFPR